MISVGEDECEVGEGEYLAMTTVVGIPIYKDSDGIIVYLSLTCTNWSNSTINMSCSKAIWIGKSLTLTSSPISQLELVHQKC